MTPSPTAECRTRIDALAHLAAALGNRTAFVLVPSPGRAADIAARLDGLPEWSAWIDNGSDVIIELHDVPAVTALLVLGGGSGVVLTVPKWVSAAELGDALGCEIPDDGSRDVVTLQCRRAGRPYTGPRPSGRRRRRADRGMTRWENRLRGGGDPEDDDDLRDDPERLAQLIIQRRRAGGRGVNDPRRWRCRTNHNERKHMGTTIANDDDDERDDPRALAAQIRGDRDDELDTLDPDSDDPRMLARVIAAARGYRGR